MNSTATSDAYQSYLLRLWRERAGDPWRATLRSTTTQQVHHFATVEALFAFLDACLGDRPTSADVDKSL